MQEGLGCEAWLPQGLSEVFSQVQVRGGGWPKREEFDIRELGGAGPPRDAPLLDERSLPPEQTPAPRPAQGPFPDLV